MMPIADLKRFLELAAGWTEPITRIQLIPQAVPGSHHLFPGPFRKCFKSGLQNFCSVAFVKMTGMVVKNIGTIIQLFFRIRNTVVYERRCLARVFVKPDPLEFRQDIPFDAVQKAYGQKADAARDAYLYDFERCVPRA